MRTDLNCDMGEGMPDDEALMPLLSSANISCGYHAGDEATLRATLELARHYGVDGVKGPEMRRVTRPGGVVAAVVWDHCGGMSGMRMMVDTVAMIDEGGRQLRSRYCFQPMMQPGEMKHAFEQQGLADVEETQLMVRMDYRSFDDYWGPIAAGEGPLGKYVATLGAEQRSRVDAAMRDAYEAGRPDGPRSFANVAWAVKGIRR